MNNQELQNAINAINAALDGMLRDVHREALFDQLKFLLAEQLTRAKAPVGEVTYRIPIGCAGGYTATACRYTNLNGEVRLGAGGGGGA